VGPKASLDGHGNSAPPPGCAPQTVQTIASCYTNYTISAHILTMNNIEIISNMIIHFINQILSQ